MFDREILQLPGIRQTLVVLVLLALLESVCILGQAWGLSTALVLLWQGNEFQYVLENLVLFACSFIAVRIVLNARERFISHFAIATAQSLRSELLQSVFRTGAPAVQAFGTGTTSTMVLEGVDKVENYLELILPKMVNMVVLPVVLAVFIFMADWVSGVVVVLLLPAIALLMSLIGKTAAAKAQSQHAAFKVMSNHFIDSVRGVSTLSTFEIARTYAKRVFEVSEQFREATLQTLKTATLSGALLDMSSTLALAAVAIMMGLRLIDGSLVLLPALFVLILVPEYFRPIREFASNYHATLDGSNSFRTIADILDATRDIPEPVALPTWNSSAVLRLNAVTKRYESLAALDEVSFSVQGQDRICVIGTSGSGKSTLLRLLAGLEDPTAGTVEVVLGDARDEQSARDGLLHDVLGDASKCQPTTFQALATLRQSDWQNQIAYIPQNPYLFHATLRENLVFYNPDASEEMIQTALEALGLTALVDELPSGLDTIIGEGGRGLSGGQAQRIALARVFLDSKRKILLFDEPTAHLDIETEYELKQPMLNLMEGKLVVFATHRLHWLNDFSHVMVLEEGKVVEQGSVEQLQETGMYFNALVESLQGGGCA